MRPRIVLPVALALVLATAGCGEFRAKLESQMMDQNFKSAVAFIELHKLRYGAYPDSLGALTFTAEFDQMWMTAVRYAKLADGYRLDLATLRPGSAEPTFPAEFWQGLGLRESNLRPDGSD